jgi:cobalamin biosynthesis Co2+ chelatase CbiK
MKLKDLIFIRQGTVKRGYNEFEFTYPLSEEQIKIIEKEIKDNFGNSDIDVEYTSARIIVKSYTNPLRSEKSLNSEGI